MLDRALNSTDAPLFGLQDGTPAGWAVSAGQVD